MLAALPPLLPPPLPHTHSPQFADQRAAKCSRFGNARSNSSDLQVRVFTVKIPFVVCEVGRRLLSLAMLEDKGFHMTVKDGCRKLGGRG